MTITRIKMCSSVSGRPVNDRFLCDFGHWHPSHRHACKCHDRERKAAAARDTKAQAKSLAPIIGLILLAGSVGTASHGHVHS